MSAPKGDAVALQLEAWVRCNAEAAERSSSETDRAWSRGVSKGCAMALELIRERADLAAAQQPAECPRHGPICRQVGYCPSAPVVQKGDAVAAFRAAFHTGSTGDYDADIRRGLAAVAALAQPSPSVSDGDKS